MYSLVDKPRASPRNATGHVGDRSSHDEKFRIQSACVSFNVLNAQEKGGKRNPSTALVTQLMKNLEKAELTADQTTKIKEMFGKVATEVAAKRAAGGLTADVLKKRLEAGKAAKEAGKKGKDLQAAISGAVALTPEQAKALEETEAMLSKARVEIGKLLTPEQLAKLPEQARNSFKEKAAGKKGKKKN